MIDLHHLRAIGALMCDRANPPDTLARERANLTRECCRDIKVIRRYESVFGNIRITTWFCWVVVNMAAVGWS